MSGYEAYSDDFYVNMNLNTELELPTARESVLHYFEQVRRQYPKMSNFYSREKDEFVLEEEKETGSYRWVSLEPKRINSGVLNPSSYDDAIAQHVSILQRVPYDLSVSPLDCESLNVIVGFDFNCKGNHNEVIGEVIGVAPGLEKFAAFGDGKVLSNEPAVLITLDEECKTQCRVSFETRTGAFQIRSGEFGEEQLSVYLTVRRYDSLGADETYAEEFKRLSRLAQKVIDETLVESVLQPLQTAISIR